MEYRNKQLTIIKEDGREINQSLIIEEQGITRCIIDSLSSLAYRYYGEPLSITARENIIDDSIIIFSKDNNNPKYSRIINIKTENDYEVAVAIIIKKINIDLKKRNRIIDKLNYIFKLIIGQKTCNT